MTYSFPCQDLSKAGKGAGMAKNSGTRSGMLWEVERILDECKEIDQLPQILLMENVPDVIGSKNIANFAKWLEKLEKLGYHCYWKVLNAKDYGIPQNRERCFMISLLGDYYYEFPKKQKLEIRLKDILEKEVDEKYYLSDKMLNYIVSSNDKYTGNNNKSIINRDIACAKTTREGNTRADTSDYVSENLNENCNLKELTQNQPQVYRVYDTEGISVSLVANGGGMGAKTGLYMINEYGEFKNFQKFGSYYTWENKKGELNTQCNRAADVNNCALTVACASGGNVYNNYRIRKLTPKECFRLMGVKDEDFDKVAKNQSNASLYHLAGDSIVVNVLMAIFKNLLKEQL